MLAADLHVHFGVQLVGDWLGEAAVGRPRPPPLRVAVDALDDAAVLGEQETGRAVGSVAARLRGR